MSACKPSGAGDNFSFVYCCLHFDTGINEYTLNRPEQFIFSKICPLKKHKNVNIFDICKFSDAQTFISRKFFHNFFSVAVVLIYNG